MIGKGALEEPIAVQTGDELEQLADEMNRMNVQLQRAFSGLTDSVERKRREVATLQVVNQQILESVPNPIILLDHDGRMSISTVLRMTCFWMQARRESRNGLKTSCT